MHIALLIYGRINQFRDNYVNIFNRIGKEHVVDVFLSSDNSINSELNEFIELYKPKKYCNDKIKHHSKLRTYLSLEKHKINYQGIYNIECHYINKKRVFSLLESYSTEASISYDCVISTRIDLDFLTPFNLINPLDNTIYIPNHYDFVQNGINDQIAYGNMNTMSKYMNIYDTIFYLLDNNLTIPHPETMTLSNIHYHNLNVVRVPISYNYNKKDVAIVLTGAMSSRKKAYPTANDNLIQDKTEYINFKATYLGIKKNIIDANPEYNFEFFIASWNPDLEEELTELYIPAKSIFENNIDYRDYLSSLGGYYSFASHALSLKKGIDLVESCSKRYEYVIWDRLDCLLWKELKLSSYDSEKIYTHKWNNANSDSFFIMNLKTAFIFRNLIDSAKNGNIPATHSWIKRYVEDYMKMQLFESEIIPGEHWEIIRKLYNCSYISNYISESQLNNYGLSLDEIKEY
jgi:hypothetical protein